MWELEEEQLAESLQAKSDPLLLSDYSDYEDVDAIGGEEEEDSYYDYAISGEGESEEVGKEEKHGWEEVTEPGEHLKSGWTIGIYWI